MKRSAEQQTGSLGLGKTKGKGGGQRRVETDGQILTAYSSPWRRCCRSATRDVKGGASAANSASSH